MSGLDGIFHGLALDQLSQESSYKGITCTVGIDKQFLGQWVYSILRHLALASNDGGFGSLGKNDGTGPAGILLGEGSNLEGDFFQIVSEAMFLAIGFRLALIAKQVIGIFNGSGDLVTEKVNDERGRQVEAKGFVVGYRVISDRDQGLDRDGQEETGNVIDLCGFVNFLGLWCLQMRGLEIVGGSQVGNEGTFPSLHQDGTRSSGRGFVHHVMGEDAIGRGTLREGRSKLILSNTSHVGRLVGLSIRSREHPLRDPNGILRRSTSNVLGLVIVDQILIEGHVLVFC
mmetsp:Transcript_5723/g.10107  ORF Transcript_5723/g.10107 Transcript_5723/m.10107 type:complete len:286 (-) Transcript_5723:139-996(-)